MASFRCKYFHKNSRLDVLISSLRKENVSLKKALLKLSHQQSENFKIVERLISFYGGSPETPPQQVNEDSETVLPSASSKDGQNRRDTVNMQRISTYITEMEDIKKKLVTISTRCQYLENKAKEKKKDLTSDEQASSSNFTELETLLKDALEKNKQWLKYDQQREACVTAITARMIWLEKKLNGAKESCSRQHNDNYSHEKQKVLQMQEYYEGLLQKAKHELDVMREQVTITQQKLTTTQKLCLKMETEAEKLKQMLRTEEMRNQPSSWKDHQGSEDEAKHLKEKTKDLEFKLREEKRRSATFELQVDLLQKYMINSHSEHQEKIADLEKQLCNVNTSYSSRSLLNESFLKCPGCCMEYPANHYQELMQHIEMCLD
ncbi:centrosomal protein of 55 kDa-like isoform X2 [Cynoglossus semilaevis]|nr:centrosomal protein of 55 kDa-like isoform X2 [Cynoglossus semilaevis]